MSDPAGDPTNATSIDDWLRTLQEALGLPADLLGAEERTQLLDLARIAARRSHRTAAPMTTYVVGLALAGVPHADRLARLHDLVAALEEA
jgi:hypothetical protein